MIRRRTQHLRHPHEGRGPPTQTRRPRASSTEGPAQVDDLNGDSNKTDPSDVDVTPDDAGNTITVEDRSGDSPATYVWQNFVFQDGKVSSWEVKGQARLTTRLWSTKSTDESNGVAAELVSAYQANNKNLTVVVKLTSDNKNVQVMSADHTPAAGYEHEDSANLSADIDKGGKGLDYFIYSEAPVGGSSSSRSTRSTAATPPSRTTSPRSA